MNDWISIHTTIRIRLWERKERTEDFGMVREDAFVNTKRDCAADDDNVAI